MTPLIICSNLTHTVGNKQLFKGIQFSINAQDRIALVGHNGSGKSTLISLLNQQTNPDEGEVSYKKGLHVETVEQFLPEHLHAFTLFEAMLEKSASKGLQDYQVSALLQELGFRTEEFNFQVKDLSGGQQNRLMFARAVLHEPEVILFDEPTNHLDLGSILFFENYFQHSLKCAFLLISHDRSFLDTVTSRTLFLRDQTIHSFNLTYSLAKKELDAMDRAAAETRRSEEQKIQSLQTSAKRFATWGKIYDNEKFAKKAKSMEKRIEKLQQEKTFVSKGSDLHLDLNFSHAKSDHLLTLRQKEIVFQQESAEKKKLFFIEELRIRPGERVAILGKNGCGKTTFIRFLVDAFFEQSQNPTQIAFSPQCKIGYYDQELEQLEPQKTIFEVLRERCLGHDSELNHQLIQAGFPYRDHQKRIEVLSGGEKARIMFLLLKINQPNFLILDEPTNHIDIQGKEELEEQLMQSQATVLLTSHDRRFVELITNRFFLIQEQGFLEIHEPEQFYTQELAFLKQEECAEDPKRVDESKSHDFVESEDELMELILELEEKLARDLQRKPKHQKPRHQEEWRHQLKDYYEKLQILESNS